jgi:hypothetical protein
MVMISPRLSALGPRWQWLSPLVIAVAVAFVYWPGVHGFWGRDDYFQLAFARLIGSPWPLFVRDHFPVPGSVFRPLGFASMWLCRALFGIDYEAHAIADLVLHAGVALALFGVLRRAGIARVPALCCTLLFALHPAVIGTALWWSARFDLLATLFVLLAVQAAFAYRDRRRSGALYCALGAALAAMLSKETGLVAVAALSLLWLQWAWSEPAHRAQALRAAVLAGVCALVYLGWRWAVLGTPSSGLTGAMPLGSAIAKGVLDWARLAPGYFSFWARLDAWQRIALGVALVAVAAASVRTLACASPQRSTGPVGSGLCLLLLPALLQAPVSALNAAPLQAGVSAIEAAMQSRLYYLGIAGTALVLAAALSRIWNAANSTTRVAVGLPLALAVLALAAASRDDARQFAQRSLRISAVAREAAAAVARLDLPPARCHVVFLDVEPAPEWSIYVSMDSVVEALAADARVPHCWFHANYATWFHLLAAPADAADAAPWIPRRVDGDTLPWRRVGDMQIAYLGAPAQVAPRDLAAMHFLRWRDGRFDDVSADVAAGRLAVRLE